MSHRNHIAPVVDPEKGNPEYANWKASKPESAKKSEKKSQMVMKEKKEKADKFDAFYKEIGPKCKPEQKRIDFVLVHPNQNLKEITDEEDKKEVKRQDDLRAKFEQAMKNEGLLIQKVVIDDNVYTKLHCPFRRMCEEAEAVSLEMPLLGCTSEKLDEPNCLTDWIKRKFITDNEEDMVSAPFMMSRIHLYDNFNDPTNFFRPSIRSLLVEHMLINIDLRYDGVSATDYKHAQQSEKARTIGNCWGCLNKGDAELSDMQKVGFAYMQVENVYTHSIILHEESCYDPDDDTKNKAKELPQDRGTLKNDPRFDMQLTWTKFFKFQPLWKIRNYFGEKIAFYFAWSGTLVSSLWLPMLFGFAIFIYGLVESVQRSNSSSTTSNTNNSTLTDLFANIKGSFDNDVTPYFAMFLSVWGTLFLEVWKRKQAELAYQWDVEQFEENEPDRPEFYGTKETVDPVTKEKDWYYPFTRRAWKILLSSVTMLFMVVIVIISVLGVIVYRVFATVDYCPNLPDSECLFVSTIVSSVLNAVSILILGKIYDLIAVKLTDWENHRTQTQYNDALIIKLFGFQFVNNYASCFYIAFFRGRFDDNGLFGRGPSYQDNCEGTCMSQLSFQVMVLMLTKPLPKLFKDIVLPWLFKHFKKRCQCFRCIPFLRRFLQPESKPKSEKTLLEIELEKPSLGNFTLSEYTEKVIQYGLMMLFAASFPLAPLLALLLNLIDLRIDAWRMLWWYQRPLAIIAEDIGTWYVILQFVNFVGVVSNAFLIAFTSHWGTQFSTVGKLWVVIGFEHIVFSLKFLLAYLIPDTPASVSLAIRKKRYTLNKVVEEDKMQKDADHVTRGRTDMKDRDDGLHHRRSTRPEGNFVMEEDTDVRRPRKKKKHRDGDRGRDVSPPEYSGRAPHRYEVEEGHLRRDYLPDLYQH